MDKVHNNSLKQCVIESLNDLYLNPQIRLALDILVYFIYNMFMLGLISIRKHKFFKKFGGR
jgi:hypothetical protein